MFLVCHPLVTLSSKTGFSLSKSSLPANAFFTAEFEGAAFSI